MKKTKKWFPKFKLTAYGEGFEDAKLGMKHRGTSAEYRSGYRDGQRERLRGATAEVELARRHVFAGESLGHATRVMKYGIVGVVGAAIGATLQKTFGKK